MSYKDLNALHHQVIQAHAQFDSASFITKLIILYVFYMAIEFLFTGTAMFWLFGWVVGLGLVASRLWYYITIVTWTRMLKKEKEKDKDVSD